MTGNDIAKAAVSSGLLGTPYNKLDCQAFIEEALKAAGMRIPNYRGSNHQWRELVYGRNPIEKVNANTIPAGTLLFKVKYDGGEQARGYSDSMGNAYHVGLCLGNGVAMHSTKGGVQYGKVSDFTHYAYIKDVDYADAEGGAKDDADKVQGPSVTPEILYHIIAEVSEIRRIATELEAWLNESL